VDRLLGANAQVPELFPEDPPQRPFDWPSVLEDMLQKGLDTDPRTGAQLVAQPSPTRTPWVGPLRPTILMVDLGEDSDILYVSGIFGERPADGTVTVDGVELPVNTWTPQMLMARLPQTGQAGAAGDVKVTVRGLESNPRRLVTWSGSLTYTHRDAGSPFYQVTLNVHGRGDPGAIRGMAGNAPYSPSPVVMDPS
jgi:hypothetical protein